MNKALLFSLALLLFCVNIAVAQPGKPLPAFPSYGSTKVSKTTNLFWSNSSVPADSFHLQVSKDTSFGSLLVNTLQPSAAFTFQPGALNNYTIYYWRVRGKDMNGYGDWSDTFWFRTIDTIAAGPKLIKPANGFKNAAFFPELMWNSSPRAMRYEVQLSTSAGFTPLLLDSILEGTRVVYLIDTLDFATPYHWRVRSENEVGWGDWSATFNFEPSFLPPSIPLMGSPMDASVNQYSTPYFDWRSMPIGISSPAFKGTGGAGAGHSGGVMVNLTIINEFNLDSLDLNISGTGQRNVNIYYRAGIYDTAITKPALWTKMGTYTVNAAGLNNTTRLRLPAAVKFGRGTYGLYIYADDSLKWTANDSSNFSNADMRIKGAVALRDAFTTILDTVAFNGRLYYSMDDTKQSTRYRLYVATDPQLKNMVYKDSTIKNSFFWYQGDALKLNPSTTYFWTVAAGNDNDFYSPANDTFMFTTSNVSPPQRPVNISPKYATVQSTRKPVFTWQDTTSAFPADSFYLHVSMATKFNDTALFVRTTAKTYATTTPLFHNTVFYWHVAGKNDGGFSPWSYFWNLTTAINQPDKNAFGATLYPNPAGNSTTFAFDLPQSQQLRIAVVDITGREVLQVFSGQLEAGKNSFDINLSTLPAGNYFTVIGGNAAMQAIPFIKQ